MAVERVAASVSAANPLHRYSDYLQLRYGAKTYRVSVDAGFTCPVRELGMPCVYCDPRGSRAPYLGNAEAIRDQVNQGLAFLRRRYAATRFLLYFQAFSGTHAPVDDLRRIYDLGLSCGEFAGLVVATRPDCLDEPRAALLAEYGSRGLDVWVELGLQSAHDATLRRIHRGHSVAEFGRAVRLAQGHGLMTAAHVILGLPGEGLREAVETARYLSGLTVDGVKFHNLVVTRGTELYRWYAADRIAPPTEEEYREFLIAALTYLAPEIVVMRVTCDPPHDVEGAPPGVTDKASFYRSLSESMSRRGLWQGMHCQ